MLRLIIATALAMAAVVLVPFHTAAFDSHLVQELMNKSGIRKQVRQIPQDIRAGIQQEQGLKQNPEMGIADIDAAIESAFNPKRIEALLYSDIGKNLSTEEIQKVLYWLDSPLGKKLTRLEEEAASPAANQEMTQALQQMNNDSGVPERLKLLQRIEKALLATEIAVDTILNIQIAIISAISAMSPAPNPPNFEQITEMVHKNRLQVQEVICPQVISGFFYTYRDVSNEDLQTYIAFIESPTGRKYHQVIMKAFSDALIFSGKNFGKAVGERMASQDHDARI
ncbi:MAG: DUF2059 domain-containing protein [Thermodesulfobacteriota bacterium]